MAVHPVELDRDPIDMDGLVPDLHLPETDTAAEDLGNFSIPIQQFDDKGVKMGVFSRPFFWIFHPGRKGVFRQAV